MASSRYENTSDKQTNFKEVDARFFKSVINLTGNAKISFYEDFNMVRQIDAIWTMRSN